MATMQPRPLAELTAPLYERFGLDLTLVRDGDRVRWCYAGVSAVIEQRSGNAVAATFVAAPLPDSASSELVCAVYAARDTTYAMTERGVASMVDDLTAFFSGVREPRFTFVDARCAAGSA